MEILIRATVIYWFIWLVVRGAGKRSLADLTPLDMVLLIVLGDILQQAITQEDMSMTGGILAVSVFVTWTLLSDALVRRSRRAGTVLASDPTIVVENGRVIEQRMRAERLSVGELCEAARQQGYDDLGDLRYGILETDGKFSFIPRDA